MLTSEAVKFFGSHAKLAKACGISRAAPYQWGKRPPPLRQIQIEKLTFGNLKAKVVLYGGRPK